MDVVKFEDLGKSDIGIAGRKGANLGELTQAGIPVPPGFVVTAELTENSWKMLELMVRYWICAKTDINNKRTSSCCEEVNPIMIGTPVPEEWPL